ncbi:hypothetical protein ATCM_07100 [Stenotrophomonas sp. ATCM1_4]|uniref:hypothetical protein n=1 Tax=Stenotrophomonas sp. ATCM1_4 TaxID=2259330 RepID=UPI0010490555|nr:hypothetical protein [Stenotrophomonas sp. ATCM1_4]TDB27446.1 hypothetical protein ATCM_07100 [Stenotrophomonas sp. ATCM1_4]
MQGTQGNTGARGTITVTLNARLQPVHRTELEDAFNDACQLHGIHAEVIGGGTLLASSGEVANCDLRIRVDDLGGDSVLLIRRLFEAMLAPVGSSISLPGGGPRIPFGVHQGLGLYLNGTDLPAEVYQTCDINHVHEECMRRLEGVGMLNSHWQGPTEAALYMYGDSFDRMHAAITPLLDSYPLCQRCRVERIA